LNRRGFIQFLWALMLSYRILFCVAGIGTSFLANATTRSSFLDVDSMTDITFGVTNLGLTVDAILGANPTFTIGSDTYHVTSIIGFYALSDDDNLAVSNSDFGVWTTDNSNAGVGGIAGWKTNPNSGFGVSNHQVFAFNTLSTSLVEGYGLHVVTQELFPGTSGFTGNISARSLNPVPEPTSILGVGLAVVALRKRKKS
jgi:hypothetical protein